MCEAQGRVGDDRIAFEYGHLNPRQDAAMLKDCRGSGFGGQLTIAKDGARCVV